MYQGALSGDAVTSESAPSSTNDDARGHKAAGPSSVNMIARAGRGEYGTRVVSGTGWVGREAIKTMTAFGPRSDQAESLHVAATHHRCEVRACRVIAR